VKRLSSKMLRLLEQMVRDPFGWGMIFDNLKDGRKKSGLMRTIYALERRALLRYVATGDWFTVDGVLHTAKGPGWVATAKGKREVALQKLNALPAFPSSILATSKALDETGK